MASERAPAQRRWVPAAAAALLGLYLIVGGASSALALRGARVRPSDRGQDLAAFRHVVAGQPTLYFGRDNFAPWELRGARLRGFQSYDTPLGTGVPEAPSKGKADANLPAADVDSVDPAFLDFFTYLITPRTAYASQMPDNIRPVARTRWDVLWKRVSGTLPRHHLAEGEAPGKVLDCRTTSGRRLAELRWGRLRATGAGGARQGPVAYRHRPGSPSGLAWEAVNGESRTQVLQLPAGTWDISLRWFSDVPLSLSAGSLHTRLPAYINDDVTFASAGRVKSDGGPLDSSRGRAAAAAAGDAPDGASGDARGNARRRAGPARAAGASLREVRRLVPAEAGIGT